MDPNFGLIAALAGVAVGVAGTVLPAVPGLPLVWDRPSSSTPWAPASTRSRPRLRPASLAVTVAAEAGEHYGRTLGARRFGASRAGVWGAVAGAVRRAFSSFRGACCWDRSRARPWPNCSRAEAPPPRPGPGSAVSWGRWASSR